MRTRSAKWGFGGERFNFIKLVLVCQIQLSEHVMSMSIVECPMVEGEEGGKTN